MKTALTGIKSTGMPHLGNFLGAIGPAIELSRSGEFDRSLYFIADYHALTSLKNPSAFNDGVYEVAATWLALGLDPAKTFFYRQSDIPEIFELAWILACHTPKGDLNRAHSYKAAISANEEKGKKDLNDGINAGLFNYPVLMASDILLFDTNIVPVGKDQVQHVEMARSMAQRVNQYYGECLVEPEARFSKGAYVIGLDGRKMSKSYNNSIPLFVPEKKLRKMINKIATDSTAENDPKDPETSSIFSLYEFFATAEEVLKFRKKFEGGISWGHAKLELFEKVNESLKLPRERYNELINDRAYLNEVMDKGALKAREVAAETMARVRKKIIGK